MWAFCSLFGGNWIVAAGRTRHCYDRAGQPPSDTDIPYVPTRHDTVKDLLWLADVGTNDVVHDLGSGDGRLVIAAVRDFGALRAVGIEINPELVRESRENAARIGIGDRVEFIQGDLFTNDVSAASVVVLYLGHPANLCLRAKLLRVMKPGARIVSHKFGMGEWQADKSLDVRTAMLGMYSERRNPFGDSADTPDFCVPFQRMNHDVLSAWIVPAPVAGVWIGEARLDSGPTQLTLTLHQRLSGLNGSFQCRGTTNVFGVVQADLWGEHLRLHCVPTNRVHYGDFLLWFDGHVVGDAMTGTLWLSDKQGTRKLNWTGRREKSNFTGTWEWPGPKGASARLRIERRDGRLEAAYEDNSSEVPLYSAQKGWIPIGDIYDFGGGFYFTLLLGQEPNGSRRTGKDCGWVIGDGIAADDSLEGSLAFYPYPDDYLRSARPPGGSQMNPPPATVIGGRRPWRPKRIR